MPTWYAAVRWNCSVACSQSELRVIDTMHLDVGYCRSLSRHACWPWFVHWLSARWTTATPFSLQGIPGQLQDRLQSVLNAAARLVFSARRSERITPLLRELHWLRVAERVTFQLCVLAYRCLHGTAPTYLAGGLLRTSILDAVCVLLTQPCWSYCPAVVQHSLTVPSRAEDCTFPVVVWQWLGDRDCTAQYTVLCPRLLTVGDSVVLFAFLFFLILYVAPAISLTW